MFRSFSGVDPELIAKDTKYDDVVGKTVLCEDDQFRRVVEITNAQAFPWLAIINERDPESKSGHFVSNLTIAHLRLGEPPPSKEAREAFERLSKKTYYAKAEEMEKRLTKKSRLEIIE